MVQQKSSTKLYESLSNIVKFYNQYENAAIDYALRANNINPNSFDNNPNTVRDYVEGSEWSKPSVKDYEKILLVLTDGQIMKSDSDGYKTDKLIEDAADIFKRMDVVLLVE